MKKQLDFRERVYRFYDAHKSKGKKFTIDHFLLGIEHAYTIRRIINRIRARIPMNHPKGAGRPALKMTKAKISRLEELFDYNCSITQRKAASKFKVSQPYINQILKTETAIKYRKKIKIPKHSDAQRINGRER